RASKKDDRDREREAEGEERDAAVRRGADAEDVLEAHGGVRKQDRDDRRAEPARGSRLLPVRSAGRVHEAVRDDDEHERGGNLHLTQSELAERVGVSRSAISELEAGRIEQPRATVFVRLAAALGIPAAALLAAAGYPSVSLVGEIEADEIALLAASLASLAG